MTIITVTIPRSTAFDTTVPTAVAMGDTAATGSAVTAARRDHLHDVFSVATEAEMIAGSSSTVPVAPAVAKHSPGMAKCWGSTAADGTKNTNDLNIASVTDTGLGNRLFVIDTDFSSSDYIAVASAGDEVGLTPRVSAFAVGSCRVYIYADPSGTGTHGLVDQPTYFVAFGDQ